MLTDLQCDGKRHSCQRCVRTLHYCPGYRSRFRFVQDTSLPRSDSLAAPPSFHGYRTSCRPGGDHPSSNINLRKTDNRLLLFCQFQCWFLPLNSNGSESVVPNWLWLLPAIDHGSTDPVLGDITLAVMLGSLGQWTANISYVRASSDYYTWALRGLRSRIDGAEQCGSDATLAAVMMFGMYEVGILCNQRSVFLII
jgi:hypothetical protein